MVRGSSEAAATAAVTAVGMRVQQEWPLVDVAVGVGPAAAVAGLPGQPGVLYVEGERPLDYHLQTAHRRHPQRRGARLFPAVDGTGVTVAVIDSGIEGTHPFFQQDGVSKVVQNRKNVCGITFDDALNNDCFQQVPTNDTDTISGGGHGTHVSGIAAGVPVTTTAPAGTELRGSAPGAKFVDLSVGAAIGLLDAASAQNWVLEHQQNPCRSAAEQTEDEVDADRRSASRTTRTARSPPRVRTRPSTPTPRLCRSSARWSRRASWPCGRPATTVVTAASPPPTPTRWTRRPAS